MSRYIDRYPTRANGIVPTVRMLMERVPSLVPEFQVDVPRKLRRRYGVDVPHYLIDIADVDTQVAVEIDGNGHTYAWDSVRDAILTDLGWSVLRFRVETVYGNAGRAARQIRALIGTRLEMQTPGLYYR